MVIISDTYYKRIKMNQCSSLHNGQGFKDILVLSKKII